MATKTATKTINEKEVVIVLVGALDGIKITTQLSKVIFPAMAAMQNGQGSITEVVTSALEHAEEINLEEIIKKLFAAATVDDFPIKPDDYFSGNYGELVDFLAFALEANFGSFFEASFLKSQVSTGRKKSK